MRHLCRLIVATLFCAALPAHADSVVKPLRDSDIVARVNGTAIQRKAVRELVQGYLMAQDTSPDPATVGRLAGDALDSLIDLELLYQESQAKGITVSDAAVDEEIAHSKSRFPDAQSFAAAMKSKGMTEDDLRRDTRKTMAVNRLLEGGVLKDVQVSPEQIRSFYEKNKEEFKHAADVRASHILIRVPEGAAPAERSAARQKAQALLAQLKSGAAFAAVARASSQDPVTASQGGDLGYIEPGEMDPAFEKAAQALAPGTLSDVVTTPYGFHIILVTARRDAGYEPLADVQDRIREVLVKSERQRRQADLAAALRKKAKVEILDTNQ